MLLKHGFKLVSIFNLSILTVDYIRLQGFTFYCHVLSNCNIFFIDVKSILGKFRHVCDNIIVIIVWHYWLLSHVWVILTTAHSSLYRSFIYNLIWLAIEFGRAVSRLFFLKTNFFLFALDKISRAIINTSFIFIVFLLFNLKLFFLWFFLSSLEIFHFRFF